MTASTIQQQQQHPSTIFGSSSPQSTTMSMLPSPPVVVGGDDSKDDDNGKIVSFDWSDLLVLQGNNDDDTNYYYNRDDDDDEDDEASFFGSNNKDFHFDDHDGNGITPPTPSSIIMMDLDKDDRMLPPRSLPTVPPSFESPCEQDHPPMMMKKTMDDTLYYSTSFLNNNNNNEPQERQLPPLAFQKRFTPLKKNKTTTKIRFASKVSIRTYNMIVSDHPCCLSGLALEFGWEHEDHSGELPTEEAELYRRRRCPRRRSYQERREYLLTYCHYTNTELDDLLARQRQERSLQTAQTSPLWSSTREQQRRKRRDEQRRLRHTKGMTSEMMED